MTDARYDIAILGGGPGGYVAALHAGIKGARVALVERDRVGGTCITIGCIPSKAFLDSSHAFRLAADGEAFGVRVKDPTFDMAQAVRRKDQVVDQLVKGIETLLKARKVDLIRGEGMVRSPGSIAVKTKDGASDVAAKAVIVATGGRPVMPPIDGLKDASPLDNASALELRTIPKRIVIIGAGIVGMEFATFFAEVGSQVVVLEALPNALAAEDQELVRVLVRALEKKGARILVGAKVTSVKGGGKGVREVSAEVGGKTETFPADEILVATGRAPLLDAVAGLGLATTKRGIVADARMRTNVDGVYAIGDVVDQPYWLAHVAMAMGEVAVDNILGDAKDMDYGAAPRIVYTHPELAAVGMSEAQAKEKFGDVKVGRFRFSASGRALALGETDGLVKMVTAGEDRRIVGVHIVGPLASELMAEATLAIRVEATAEDIAETMHAHPTLAEPIHEAALAILGRPIHTTVS